MYQLELRALLHQCIRLGTFFSLSVAQKERCSSGRDEYHLNVSVEPGERLAGLGRVCIVQFDALALGRNDHGVLPAVPTLIDPQVIHLRTNHVQNQFELNKLMYLWVNDEKRGHALSFDNPGLSLETTEPGHYTIRLLTRSFEKKS
jgi:hypothetical protein